MPYITASIILQIAGVLYPPLERIKKEGEAGRKKINQLARYFTLVLALVQGTAGSWLNALTNQEVVRDTGMSSVFLIVLTLTAGTAFLMWLGEEITAKGVGNGISLLIMAGIVAGLPSATYTTIEAAFVTQNNSFGPVNLLVLLGIMLAIVAAIVYVERGQRRLPAVCTSSGRWWYGELAEFAPAAQGNTSGVIPPIFASSCLCSRVCLPVILDLKCRARFKRRRRQVRGLQCDLHPHGDLLCLLLHGHHVQPGGYVR